MNDRKLETLLLSEDDLIEAGVLDMHKCVKTMIDVFQIYETGDWRMSGKDGCGHGGVVTFPDNPPCYNMPKNGPDRRYVAMGGYLGGRFRACGGKYYGSNRENLSLGLPRSILTAFLNDTDTGAPLAIMSGCLISTMRTGAMPGVANKYLQASNAHTIGIVGAGVISHACCLSLVDTMPNCDHVYVYDIIRERAESFSKEMTEMTGLPVEPVSSLEELARQSDAISLASSGTNPAHIKSEWLKEGATILISGGGQLDDDIYLDPDNVILVDCHRMHEHSMENCLDENGIITDTARQYSTYQYFKLVEQGKVPFGRAVELSKVVSGKIQGRVDNKHHGVFLSGGLALEDVAWIYEMYQSALRKGIGTRFKFWDEPHWM